MPLEMIGGSLDGSMIPVPLPLPKEFLQVVRKPRDVEVYAYEERPPKEGSSNRRIVYVFQCFARTSKDI
jgi:hypothetical protein